MSCSSSILKETNSESNEDSGGLDHEVSEGNTNSINWDRSHSYDILSNNLAEMCPCQENLYEAKLKSNGLITLMEEIPRQYNSEFGEWLLLITFMKVYNEKKKEQVGQKEIKKMCSLERKRT